MKPLILVAGGTGNLGERIVRALISRGADVRALVRPSGDRSKLEKLGAKVIEVDMSNMEELVKACDGVACVVSALAGFHDVIVDAQTLLLNAAVTAKVPRFIPSDYSCDFTDLPEGENRNFDLRREFQRRLKASSIASTAIFNGAFTDILQYNTPVYDVKNHSVSYWDEKADWKIDFTTMDDTAAFTAAAALDADAPESLHIASFQVTPRNLSALGKEIKNEDFELKYAGTLEELDQYNKRERAADPAGENKLYPKWQSSQYVHSMFSVHNEKLDNDRYPDLEWMTLKEVLSAI